MVIGLLAITSIPTVIGVGQAISVQKKQNAASKEQEKFNLIAEVESPSGAREAGTCVLRDGKIYLHHNTIGHKFCGYYFKYPGEDGHLGLVSTIADDPPMLHWIYVDSEKGHLSYGARKATLGHVIGPWGWSANERYLELRSGHEDFVLVQETDRVNDVGTGQAATDGAEEAEEDGENLPVRWGIFWDPDGKVAERVGKDKCRSIRLWRKKLMGVESRYVND